MARTAKNKSRDGLPEPPPPSTGDANLDAHLSKLADPGEGRKAVWKIEGRGPKAVSLLLARLGQVVAGVAAFEWDERSVAKMPARTQEKLRRAHASLDPAFKRRAQHVRLLGDAIISYRDPSGEKALLALATSHPNRRIRRAVAESLLGKVFPDDFGGKSVNDRVASKSTLETLAARIDEDADIAAEASFLLDPGKAYDRLARHLGFKPDESAPHALAILSAAMRHLGADGDKRWIDLACAIVENDDAPVWSISLLEAMPDARAVEPLLAHIAREKKKGHASKVPVVALAAIGDPRGATGALDVLESPRLTADFTTVAELVEGFGNPAVVPRLQALAASLRAERKRSNWRDPKIIDKVIARLSRARS